MICSLSFGLDPETRERMICLEVIDGKVQTRFKFTVKDATSIGTMLLEASAKLGPTVKLAGLDEIPETIKGKRKWPKLTAE